MSFINYPSFTGLFQNLPSLGMLHELDCIGGHLTGLNLSYKNLSSIPPALNSLVTLQRLDLSHNPLTGPLPVNLIALGSLNVFFFDATDLCEPSDPAFQQWLQSIPDRRSTGMACHDLILTMKPGQPISAVEAYLNDHQAVYTRLFDPAVNFALKETLGIARSYLVQVSPLVNPEALRRDLVNLYPNEVESCVENLALDVDTALPNEYDADTQKNLKTIGMETVWLNARALPAVSSVKMVMIDSPVEANHPDLPASLIATDCNTIVCAQAQADCERYVCQAIDPAHPLAAASGHGTHVAGIAAAVNDNNIGIVSVAGASRLISLAVTQTDQATNKEYAKFTSVFRAIEHAVDEKFKHPEVPMVINLSLSTPIAFLYDSEQTKIERARSMTVFHKWIQYAYRMNVPIVTSMGNLNWGIPHYPAMFEETIAVGATDASGNRWDAGVFGSNYGSWIDLVAPGVNILSTTSGGNYGTKTGTSMAAPHVTGVLGLLLSQNPNYTIDELRAMLEEMASPVPNCPPEKCGAGMVNAAKALTCAAPHQHISLTPTQHDFGTVAIGDFATEWISLTRACSEPTFMSVEISPPSAEFILLPSFPPCNGDKTCQVGIKFAPQAAGAKSAELVFTFVTGSHYCCDGIGTEKNRTLKIQLAGTGLTAALIPIPTVTPTPEPTLVPTETPTVTPTPEPTPMPTLIPTETPTATPTTTVTPTAEPAATITPTVVPTGNVTLMPTLTPKPTVRPTRIPTKTPIVRTPPQPLATSTPTAKPTATITPTAAPTGRATLMPTTLSTPVPTVTITPPLPPQPTALPTNPPTVRPTLEPTATAVPTIKTVSSGSVTSPTALPTATVTPSPKPKATVAPTRIPTPTVSPTLEPTVTALPPSAPMVSVTSPPAVPIMTVTPTLRQNPTAIPMRLPVPTPSAVFTPKPMVTATPTSVPPASVTTLTAIPTVTVTSSPMPEPTATATPKIALTVTPVMPVSSTLPQQTDPGVLLAAAELAQSQGQLDEALALYRQVAQAYHATGDLRSEADLLLQIGYIYLQQQNYADAVTTYDQAVTILRAVDPHIQQILQLIAAGDAQSQQGLNGDAIEAYQNALAIIHETGSLLDYEPYLHNQIAALQARADAPLVPESDQALLTVKAAAAEHPEMMAAITDLIAIGRDEEALDAVAVIVPAPEDTAAMLLAMALEAVRASEFYQAANVLQDAETSAAQIAAAHLKISVQVQIENLQSVIAYETGDYQAAQRHAEAALTLQIGAPTLNPVGEATMLNNLALIRYQHAQILATQGRLEEAQTQFQDALQGVQQALTQAQASSNRATEGTLLNNLGLLYANLARLETTPAVAQAWYARALASYQAAFTIIQAVGGPAGQSATLHNIGEMYAKLGDADRASATLRQALTLEQALGNRFDEARTLGDLGYLAEQQGKLADALTWYEQALTVQEDLRTAAKLEEFKLGLTEQAFDLYQRAFTVATELGRLNEAFLLSERAQARTLLDLLGNAPLNLHQAADPALLAAEQRLRAELADAYRRLRAEWELAAQNLQDDRSVAIDALKIQIAQTQQAYAELLLKLKVSNPAYADLISVAPFALTQIQALLDEQTTLLKYVVTPTRTAAFVITRQRCDLVWLPVTQVELTTAIRVTRKAPEKQGLLDLQTPPPDTMQTNLRQLYQWLIAPVRHLLTTEFVGIIPHEELHYLAMSALLTGNPDAPYFSDEFLLFTLPSANVLQFLTPKAFDPAVASLLAVGYKGFEPQPLKYAEQEARDVNAIQRGQLLIGDEANEQSVTSLAGKFRILHFSTHAQLDPQQNPFFSGMVLPDGLLQVAEVFAWLLPHTDLVVLSACNTEFGVSFGQQRQGQEIVALNRAFMYAGAPSVVATLWSVNEQPTAELMVSFHTYLNAGLSKAKALQQAQRDTRRKYPDPYYWAGFNLSGLPGNIALAVPPTQALRWVSCGLAIFVVGWWLLRRRNRVSADRR